MDGWMDDGVVACYDCCITYLVVLPFLCFLSAFRFASEVRMNNNQVGGERKKTKNVNNNVLANFVDFGEQNKQGESK